MISRTNQNPVPLHNLVGQKSPTLSKFINLLWYISLCILSITWISIGKSWFIYLCQPTPVLQSSIWQLSPLWLWCWVHMMQKVLLFILGYEIGNVIYTWRSLKKTWVEVTYLVILIICTCTLYVVFQNTWTCCLYAKL